MSSELPDLDEAISFAVDNGAQAGPFAMRSIVESVMVGQRAPSTLVWWAGEPDWVPFDSVPGLLALTQDHVVEELPPPPSGTPLLGADPADATMSFGSPVADPQVFEPQMEAAVEPEVFEPQVAAAAEPQEVVQEAVAGFEPQATAESVVEASPAAEVFGGADVGSPGDVIEISEEGLEVDASQTWAAPDAIVETASELVETESGDFSWASPDPGPAADVWAEPERAAEAAEVAEAAESVEPESTNGGGLSSGLFGAGAGAVAAAGGVFGGAEDSISEVVPDAGDLGEAASSVVPEGLVPDAGVSPLASVNERIEALGAESPLVAEPVAEVAAEVAPEPVFEAPAPAEPEPAFEAPVEPVASFEAPVAAEPVEAVVAEAPVEEAAAIVDPAFEEPVVAEPLAEALVAEEPIVEEVPVAAEAAVDPEVAARAALFGDLLDKSALVEGDEVRSDRKIDVLLAGFMNVAANRGLAVLDMVATGLRHSVRFENPADGSRTTVALGNAGEHVRMAFGFGTPVADPESVLTSTAWDDGPIMIGADTDDGLAFTGVDLYVNPSDYVTANNTVDAAALGATFDALTQELRNSLTGGLEA